ncbi:MAG: cob(I)yrinic acid a,c-diamide adenosyltransferase [Bacillota bacterium]
MITLQGDQKIKGMIHVYMGTGKGKTTAALGLGLRAIGRGLRVIMVQFLKGMDTGELHSVRTLEPQFQILRFERPHGFVWMLSKEDRQRLEKEIQIAWEYVQKLILGGECEVLILDELLDAIENKLIDLDEVIRVLKNRSEYLEIVLTGRSLPRPLMEMADLVTEMNEIKHYFHSGVPARLGIEY